MLVLEALYQYCVRSGITVISHEEAALLSKNYLLPSGYNYFPNPTFATTPKTITDSSNAPAYPDGWNGGIITDGALHINSAGTFFTRQYAIKSGVANITFKGKGTGTIKIRKILNKDLFSDSEGSFELVKTYNVNSVDFADFTDTLTIPDAPLETYSAPTTPQEEAYQNYMKGYGDKWCGIQIEMVTTGVNELYLKDPEILIT